jgi:Family of unknown function (DUF5763)
MAVCRATKRDGRPCTLSATDGNGYCWAHSPRHVAKRKQIAAKGGRSRVGGELVGVKAEIRQVIEAVRTKALERSTGAVVFQGYNTLLKALDTERRIRETEELAREVEELREMVEANKERNRYGVS